MTEWLITGEFNGIYTYETIKHPCIKITGEYKTVRYGWVKMFGLFVPPETNIQKIKVENKEYIVLELPKYKIAYKVVRGGAYGLDYISIADQQEVEEVMAENRIIREAKAVF
ncbi:MAG: hypothetical protein QXO40_05765 [Candidatus Aenigmatarchaeota archaeon]